MDTLKDKLNANQVRNCLRGLRSGIEAYKGAYESAMERVGSQSREKYELSKRVFAWIVHAKRQLHIAEVKHALGTCIGKSRLDPDDFMSEQTMLSVCAGLVSYDDRTKIIRLVHYTAQEYFRDHWLKWFKDESAEITSTCITYMSFSSFKSGPCRTQAEADRRSKDYVLLNYAARHWGDHAREQETIGNGNEHELEGDKHESHTRIAMSFLLNEPLVFSAFQAMVFARWGQEYFVSPHTQALHLTTYFGIHGLSALLLDNKADVNAVGSFYDEGYDTFHQGVTPLYIACYKGDGKIATLLLDKGADINAQIRYFGTALHGASLRGDKRAAKPILDTEDVQIDSTDDHRRIPLSSATEESKEAIVKLLLGTEKVEVDSKDGYGRTPLSFAAESGNEKTVRLLIETGKVEIDSNDKYSRTPLSYAAANGKKATVQLLVETGKVEVDSKDQHGRTVLSLAAKRGWVAIVKLLLETGKVEVDSKDEEGWTPLSHAAARGYEAIAKLLVETGKVDVVSKDSGGRTPLRLAIDRGYSGIVKLLTNVNNQSRQLMDLSLD